MIAEAEVHHTIKSLSTAKKMAKTTMVIIAAVVMVLINGIAANTLVVGGDEGWKVPESKNFYISWAAKQIFTVGDTLAFNFSTGSHTVAIVTLKKAYDECVIELDMDAVEIEEGPYERNLTIAGQFYFFCTIGSHCDNGLKFAANVTSL